MPIDVKTVNVSKRKKQDDQVLQHLASENGSLSYECLMMNEAVREWKTSAPGIHQNLAIECFLLHFRIIREFLYPTRNSWTDKIKLDDVIAFDFAEQWLETEEDWIECSPNERHRINKLLAHISYSRPTLDHSWPIPPMLAAIRKSFAAFVARLPQDRQHWFSHYGA
jgi:hypothetical protein